MYLWCELNLCSRLAGVMVLVSVDTSSIGVSSMSVSFCGDIAGDLTATRFLAEDPVCLLEGVLMEGNGRGML